MTTTQVLLLVLILVALVSGGLVIYYARRAVALLRSYQSAVEVTPRTPRRADDGSLFEECDRTGKPWSAVMDDFRRDLDRAQPEDFNQPKGDTNR